MERLLLGLAVPATATLVAWELRLEHRGGEPVIQVGLLRAGRAFGMGQALALLYFAGFTSLFFTLSILWQEGLGHSALQTGLPLPFAAGSMLTASNSYRFSLGSGSGGGSGSGKAVPALVHSAQTATLVNLYFIALARACALGLPGQARRAEPGTGSRRRTGRERGAGTAHRAVRRRRAVLTEDSPLMIPLMIPLGLALWPLGGIAERRR